MHTVIVTIPNGAVSYGLLRTGFLAALLSGGGVRVILLVPPYREEYYKKEFMGRTDVIVESAPTDRYKKFEERANRVLRQSIPTTTIYNRQMHAFYSKRGFVRWFWLCATRAMWLLGHVRPWRRFLRFLYSFSPCSAYMPIIDTHKPDLVFATTLYDRMDLGLMKAARRKGVRIVGMTKSWDSITSKCFLAVHPDHLLVQNELLRREAVSYMDYPEQRVTVCGIPQFDFYFHKNILMPRDEFLRTIGVAPTEHYVLFGGEGLDLFPGECEVLSALANAMGSDPRYARTKVLYRPHPNYPWCERASELSNVIVDMPGKRIQDTAGGWEFETDDIQHLVNSIFHADALITMASTLVLEAAILDRPSIGIAFDGEKKLPFYLSVERYYCTNHFSNVVATGAVRVVRDRAELLDAVAAYHANPALDTEGRRTLVREQVHFTDGKSAERLAFRIREILSL
ncbi:hypothetical protein COU20_02280 [Candidatus Kaiserbacteria bacterium CG10_big_fil_rev_8_21_14_0_10_59_10]|uniref:Uncharacterized protein n=1 Tax=Candidatus Kaiserbacteria bacterium CG10_big_fil_rev_8_21_14_0_10_59_10 TaxID=1974612 RepID=A0A2H0U7P9_9BACT|nr:MAG: hypothetical protein COU20_02280 [Candidatus Kaiserbacteria bacterium CG10_big_fil_rev_8_21_14_0_10_59_10]